MASPKKMTPMMRQYFDIKKDHQDAILLYRMGDFFETFNEDAKVISKVLGIALTKRGGEDSTPLAGFPHHALDAHLPKLLNAGHKVARCEQVEDPKQSKGIVKREVVEVSSPGSTLSEKLLDHKFNNYICAVFLDKGSVGFVIADISTGEFLVSEFDESVLTEQLLSYTPREILISSHQKDEIQQRLKNVYDGLFSIEESWFFDYEYAYDQLKDHFKTHSLKGFGCDEMPLAISASGALINYLRGNYKSDLDHISTMSIIETSNYMMLDISTKRNLEIVETIQDSSRKGTLISILDDTKTPMGSRLLKKWIASPLIKLNDIVRRHDLVESIISSVSEGNDIQSVLNEIGDIERILSRISTGRCSPRDLKFLKNSLGAIQPLNDVLLSIDKELWTEFVEQFDSVESVIDIVENAISEDAPNTITEGNIIRQGYNEELDELKSIATEGKGFIARLQAEEREKTGIPSLKVKFNKVFGYYIDITNTHKDKVPEHYIRKQTLVNSERYITEELKEYEEKVLGAEDKIKSIEYTLFQEIREQITQETKSIQKNAKIISEIDCLTSFARVSIVNNYTRPQMEDSGKLSYVKGRHPVIEHMLEPGTPFITNDCMMNLETDQLMMITGPNMAGKSTFLRQTGLIVLMAQIGCYVPANDVIIGVCDRIFTRVGASDNLSSGESTFLVEMNEAANILNNTTDKSLILFDELGRGTSTFDGLSIAWAVCEYLVKNNDRAAKTLFATHYHELTELESMYPRITNYNVSVEEYEDTVIFLRKIIKGGTDNSYGIQVAKMAGLPDSVIDRAKEILSNLEENELSPNNPRLKNSKKVKKRPINENQLTMFSEPVVKPSIVEERLKNLSIDHLTPIDALNALNELKKLLED